PSVPWPSSRPGARRRPSPWHRRPTQSGSCPAGSWTSPASPCWLTPWKRAAARRLNCSHTCAGRGLPAAVAGPWPRPAREPPGRGPARAVGGAHREVAVRGNRLLQVLVLIAAVATVLALRPLWQGRADDLLPQTRKRIDRRGPPRPPGTGDS